MNKRPALGLALLISASTARASTLQWPSPEDICKADAIVMGEMTAVRKGAVTVTRGEPNPSETKFDEGTLKVAKRMKAWSYVPEDAVKVLFPSWTENVMKPRIWFLRYDAYLDAFVMSAQGRPLETTREPEVAKLLKEMKCDFPMKLKRTAVVR